MSIENRLAAKKRSAKARKRAKMKSAIELGLIILIPVVILLIVLLIYNNIKSKEKNYSKYLTSEGVIEGYNALDSVTLPDFKDLGIKYDDYAPTNAQVDAQIVSALREKLEQPSKENMSAEEKTEDDKRVLNLLTDAVVEEHFASVMTGDYPHTKEGYRRFVADKMQKDSYSSGLESAVDAALLEKSTVDKNPPKKFIKNQEQIIRNEMIDDYEFYKSYNITEAENAYIYYGGKDEFNKSVTSKAEDNVKMYAVYQAAFEKLGLVYDATAADTFIRSNLAYGDDETYDKYMKEYGAGYLTFLWRRHEVVEHIAEIYEIKDDTETTEDPEVTPSVTPEATPSVTPEATPEVTPSVTPEATPEPTPTETAAE